MPCIVYGSPGTFTWTWPDGVTSAYVTCVGGSGGGGAGTAHRGAGAGGGGAFAGGVVTKTDATATVVVGAGGAGGTTAGADGAAGQGSLFSQTSSTSNIGADGGAGSANAAGGAGGTVAASEGDILYAGGNGGSRISGDDGGGGGATACDTANGANGDDGGPTSSDGLGGATCPNTGQDGTGGGNGGHDGTNGGNGQAGGGGGGGTNGTGGNGTGGVLYICWENPLPYYGPYYTPSPQTGYCQTRGCWWPNCGYSGTDCFYYDTKNVPKGGYAYIRDPKCDCLPRQLPSTLTATIEVYPTGAHNFAPKLTSQTWDLQWNDDTQRYEYIGVPHATNSECGVTGSNYHDGAGWPNANLYFWCDPSSLKWCFAFGDLYYASFGGAWASLTPNSTFTIGAASISCSPFFVTFIALPPSNGIQYMSSAMGPGWDYYTWCLTPCNLKITITE